EDRLAHVHRIEEGGHAACETNANDTANRRLITTHEFRGGLGIAGANALHKIGETDFVRHECDLASNVLFTACRLAVQKNLCRRVRLARQKACRAPSKELRARMSGRLCESDNWVAKRRKQTNG